VDFRDEIILDHRVFGDRVLALETTHQTDALKAIEKSNLGGIVQLYCGGGKTYLALKAIARSRAPAIILADNLDLLGQWGEAVAKTMGVRPILLKGDRSHPLDESPLVLSTYATLASLRRRGRLTPERQRRFKNVFFDEAHHVHAHTYLGCAEAFSGRRIALTATPERRDGLHLLQEFHLGPLLYRNLLSPLQAQVLFLSTGATCSGKHSSGEKGWVEKAEDLGGNEDRLAKLAVVLEEMLQAGRRVLVLSASLSSLANLMAKHLGEEARAPREGRPGFFLRLLSLPGAQNIGAVTAEVPPPLQRRRSRLTFAYRSYGREGYDDESLDTVLMLEPTSDPGILQQVMGRSCRIYPGKKDPLLVVVEDSEGAMASCCKEMRRLLNSWPEEAGGKVKHGRRVLS